MKWLLGSNLSQHKLCWLWMNDPLWHPWMGLWFCVWQRTYDQHSRVLPPLQPGSRLAIPSRTDTDWFLLGTIFELCHHRTYVVQTGKGSVLIQNRRFSTARKIGFTQIYSVQIWCKTVQTRSKSKAKMVNTAFACQFTWGCKFEGKCGIYHLCLLFNLSVHFFAPNLHWVNLM